MLLGAAFMLIDTRELASDRQLHYDVCIIGAGAAGITLARARRSEPVSICLLESGAGPDGSLSPP